jgi:hypothetical protein
MKTGSAIRSGLALALTGSVVFAVPAPAQADDGGGALAAGIISGTALGIIASTPGPYAGPPPPPPPARSYYAPASAPGPGPYGLRCWYEPSQVWDGYGFVVRPVRVCD